MLACNTGATGDAFRFGYELLSRGNHGLGFHRAPWGESHSAAPA